MSDERTHEGAMRGIYNIVPTPFDETGAIDVPSLRRLIDFVIGTGVDGLTILGFLGEAAKLTEVERATVIDVTLEVNDGRVPVVVGATALPSIRACATPGMPPSAVRRACSSHPRAPTGPLRPPFEATTRRWPVRSTSRWWCKTSRPARGSS